MKICKKNRTVYCTISKKRKNICFEKHVVIEKIVFLLCKENLKVNLKIMTILDHNYFTNLCQIFFLYIDRYDFLLQQKNHPSDDNPKWLNPNKRV